jgi:hypothetical protein
MRFDPGANWMDPVNTSPYFIELIPMYVKDVQARMKNVPTRRPARRSGSRWTTPRSSRP